jgi:hypothetical protein
MVDAWLRARPVRSTDLGAVMRDNRQALPFPTRVRACCMIGLSPVSSPRLLACRRMTENTGAEADLTRRVINTGAIMVQRRSRSGSHFAGHGDRARLGAPVTCRDRFVARV